MLLKLSLTARLNADRAPQLKAGVSQRPQSDMTKHGSKLPLQAEYHDSIVEGIELGPRCEVVLTVSLDPVWNNGNGASRRLHFSAIKNFDEVSTFFGRATPESVDEIMGIVLVAKGVIGIELDHLGYVELRGAKVREL